MRSSVAATLVVGLLVGSFVLIGRLFPDHPQANTSLQDTQGNAALLARATQLTCKDVADAARTALAELRKARREQTFLSLPATIDVAGLLKALNDCPSGGSDEEKKEAAEIRDQLESRAASAPVQDRGFVHDVLHDASKFDDVFGRVFRAFR